MPKGKKAEMRFVRTVTEIALREPNVDFTRHTTTNTPDRGEDLNLRAPANLGEKFKEIIEHGTTTMPSSTTSINIRVDVKDKKGDKDDAEKFIDDIKKNPKSDEHWFIAKNISGPAAKTIDEAQSNFKKPIRRFSFDEMTKIEATYSALPEYDEDS